MDKNQRNELIIKLVKEGKTNKEIMDEINVMGCDISTRTIQRVINDMGDDINREDYLGYGSVAKSTFEQASIDNAKIEKADIRDLEEGRFYFYNNKTDEFLYEGTLEEFLEKFNYMERRFKSYYLAALDQNKDQPCIIGKYGIRIERNFNKQFFDAKSEIEELKYILNKQQKEIDELKSIIKELI